ncbi:unnamed protein product [Penicillium pancosmium]
MEPGDKKSCSVPLSGCEKNHKFSTYEKRPHGDLLGEQSKKNRTYFDSDDLALSTAPQVTNEGAIQTGRVQPDRKRISLPYSATQPPLDSSNPNLKLELLDALSSPHH